MRHVLETVLTIPLVAGVWYLFTTSPKTKRQNQLAVAILAYFALYWLIFLRH